MRKSIIALAIAALPAMMITSCSKDDNNNNEPNPPKAVTEKEVMENYANIVHQNYVDAREDAKKLVVALKAFTGNPSEETQKAAKDAWLVSRESYGPSEAYRFAEGPIDGDAFDGGPEGLLNSWPLDENYIDYVQDKVDSGIINNVTEFPNITKELLESLNQASAEENVSVGYHAVEFLLWGQDLTAPSEGKAGMRKYTDYTTKSNADRRKKYLNIAGELIVEHLDALVNQWKKGGSYRTEFLAMDPKVALTHVLTGIATLSSDELAGERMNVALKNQSQEDEHSCFSDNTHRDIRLNFDGIWNVYYGVYKYGNVNIKGASLAKLVEQKDSNMAKEVNKLFEETKNKVYAATEGRFDIAISSGKDSAEGKKVAAAVNSLMDLGAKLVEAGKKIGLDPTNEPKE